jgi:hypothetical protein
MIRRRWELVVCGLVLVISAGVFAKAAGYYGRALRGWDAQFYYAAAASVVADRDLDLTNQLEHTPYPEPFLKDGTLDLPRRGDGKVASKYPLGLSLVEVPFLAVGKLVRAAAGSAQPRPPGYSDAEIATVGGGLLLAFAAGVWSLLRLLGRVVPPAWAVVAFAAAWAGTSLLYYSAVFPFMAHAVGFALVVWAVYVADGIGEGETNRRLAALGVYGGLLFLVRPQQVFLGLVLVLWKGRAVARLPRAEYARGLVLGAAAFLGCVALHVLFIHQQFGTWSLSGYAAGGEGFDWLHPRFGPVLVGPTRGVLVYSPVVVLAAVGYLLGRRAVPGFAWVFAVHAIIQVYVVACWSSPDQGNAFGGRMLCEAVPAVAAGLALLYRSARDRGRGMALIALASTAAAVLWTLWLMAWFIRGDLSYPATYSDLLRAVCLLR